MVFWVQWQRCTWSTDRMPRCPVVTNCAVHRYSGLGMLKMNTRIETDKRSQKLMDGEPAKGVPDIRRDVAGAAVALRRLGQRSTATVIAEEMGCPAREFPDLLIAMLADRGDTFTTDPLGNGLKRLDGIQFGLLEWRRVSDPVLPTSL